MQSTRTHPAPAPMSLEDKNRHRARELLLTLLPYTHGQIFFSPGNRCGPLTIAALQLQSEGLCEVYRHYDERVIAFAAEGAARCAGRPSLLFCTSGSAVANLLPGCCEAAAQGTGLLLLTADRPPEAHGRGSHQTWPHLPLLAGACIHQLSLPCPEEAPWSTLEESIRHAATAALQGPVQINCPFREPLYGSLSGRPPLEAVAPPQEEPPPELGESTAELFQFLSTSKRPLITLGSMPQPLSPLLLKQLLHTGATIVADPLSQWAHHASFSAEMITHPEAWLERASPPPTDTWVHLGGALLSLKLVRWLRKCGPRSLVISQLPYPWDPAFCSPQQRRAAPWRLPPLPIEPPTRYQSPNPSQQGVTSALTCWEQRCIQAMEALWKALPSQGQIFVGNSTAIRLLPFLSPRKDPPRVWGNRGLAGIDGNIATAMGIALRSGTPTVAVVGDYTALYDLSALACAPWISTPVVVLVLNDFGGGIFSKLAPPPEEPYLTQGFVAAHHYRFQSAANLFGFQYEEVNPQDWSPTVQGKYLFEVLKSPH